MQIQTPNYASISSHPFGPPPTKGSTLKIFFKRKSEKKPQKMKAEPRTLWFFVFIFIITEFSPMDTWTETQVQWTLTMGTSTSFCSYLSLPIFFMYNLLSLILLAFPWGYNILKSLHFFHKYLLWSLYIEICLIHLNRDIKFPWHGYSIF